MKGRIREVLADILGAVLLFAFLWLVADMSSVFLSACDPLTRDTNILTSNSDGISRLAEESNMDYFVVIPQGEQAYLETDEDKAREAQARGALVLVANTQDDWLTPES